jgi:uncharacterized protein YndB with AHSA1/START domain
MSANTSTTTLNIERTFEAPREVIWKAWSEPETIKKWWGPRHFTIPVCNIDFRVGGRTFSSMKGPMPDGTTIEIWSVGVYKEIVPLELIVTTDSFADPDGNPVPASYYGMGEGFEEEAVIELRFKDLGNRTEMKLRHIGMPSHMAVEATMGWNESFDKLVELLAKS